MPTYDGNGYRLERKSEHKTASQQNAQIVAAQDASDKAHNASTHAHGSGSSAAHKVASKLHKAAADAQTAVGKASEDGSDRQLNAFKKAGAHASSKDSHDESANFLKKQGR